jgi:hypothetical protein
MSITPAREVTGKSPNRAPDFLLLCGWGCCVAAGIDEPMCLLYYSRWTVSNITAAATYADRKPDGEAKLTKVSPCTDVARGHRAIRTRSSHGRSR